ncbi:MAG: ABC transporter permease [Nocardioides sp.]
MTAYAGTLQLTRRALRRDRVLVSVWVALLTVVVLASAAATADLYPSESDRVQAATVLNQSAAVVALYGPVLDVHSLGELAMTKLTVLYAVVVALLLLVVVRRHTRGDEESGHAELLGGTAIGPRALLAAAVLEGVLLSVAVGVLAAAADVAGGLPTVGSLAFGASWAGVALVAVGLTAVCCQLSASSRTCAGLAGGGVATLYALRAVGDVGPGWLSWLSPFGWSTRLRAWHDPRWWVLLLDLGLAVALVALAQVLREHRDLGSGLLPDRPGPAHGAPRLSDVLALAWRVHRTTLVSWTVGCAAMGAVMGAIAPGVEGLLDTDLGRRMMASLGGPGALEDALLAAVLSLAGVVVTCFALAVVGHGGADEHDGRTEQVLATAQTRTASFAAGVVVAAGGSAWLLGVTGLTTGLALGRDVPGLVAAGLAQAPAVWVVLGATVLLFAVRNRWAVLGWAVLGACFVVGQLGELLRLPAWVTDLSPYAHSPAMPAEAWRTAPVLVLTGLAATLLGAAWWRYGERDIG